MGLRSSLVADRDVVERHLSRVRLDFDVLSPSDRAWVMYARGEALSAAADPGATTAFAEAVELARTIGNPFVTSVARMSLDGARPCRPVP